METTRRDLVKTAAATAAALAIPAERVRAQETPLRVGLVGCGGRGTGAAQNVLDAEPQVEIVALADMFQTRVDRARTTLSRTKDPRVKIENDRCFAGFDGFKRLLDTPCDYVLLAEPPGFRPLHLAEAVAAGKHCFVEKPTAVDPAGVRKVIEAGEKAKAKHLGIHASTELRHSWRMVETVRRIHAGEIGRIVAGRCCFNTGGLWKFDRRPGESDMEWQVRNWYYFDWLSGDHLVEQHVHELDLCHWVMRATPLRAIAVGGRQQRTEPVYGNIYDHFAVDYEFPNNVHIASMCRQWVGTPGKIAAYFVGTKGEASLYEGKIRGEDGEVAWAYEGESPNPHVQEHKDFLASIRSGKPNNEARQLAESTLIAILGRTAAYTGQVVTWEDMMQSDLDYSPPKYEFGPLPIRPVPAPGRKA
jgi:predicted dehydrogenase